jgi:menaquinone-dependent protoporphyrinogen oxidase
MSRILIAFASSHGQTQKIAESIARDLRRSGHVVELANALEGTPPPVQDYDAVILGSRVHFGTHARPIVSYIAANRAALEEIPSYFFSVSMSTVGTHAHDPEGVLSRLFMITRWQPREALAFSGGLPYRQYGPVLRTAMKLVSKHNGHATDTSRDHEYTDWSQVRRFATRVATDLMTPRFFPVHPVRPDAKA